jgi:hypothetical protein
VSADDFAPRPEAPRVPAWQLAIRFALEVAAVVLVGRVAARHVPTHAALAAWGGRALAIGAWVTFAVRGDPSRSGRAPVPVPGVVRLVLEVAIFTLAALGLAEEGFRGWLAAYLALLVVHHAGTLPRVRWLLRQ